MSNAVYLELSQNNYIGDYKGSPLYKYKGKYFVVMEEIVDIEVTMRGNSFLHGCVIDSLEEAVEIAEEWDGYRKEWEERQNSS